MNKPLLFNPTGSARRILSSTLRPILGSFSTPPPLFTLITNSLCLSLTDHIEYLREVLGRLKVHTFYIRRTKYCFGLTELNYLGHIISIEGVKPDPDKITAMKEWPVRKSVKQVRVFLGLTKYYRWFISHYAQVASSMTE